MQVTMEDVPQIVEQYMKVEINKSYPTSPAVQFFN
jgi:hypothetical protein